MRKNCSNCDNCEGWYDEGYGMGEYICRLDDTEEGCPECDEKGDCPGWIERGAR